ncbi:MAG: hypothetical protein ACLFS4_02445 [Opitutales bacterium]
MAVITMALIFGLVSVVLSRLGAESLEGAFLALLIAVTLGVFVYRERSLLERVEAAERSKFEIETEYRARIENLYTESLATLACFDANNLIVERVSSGFAEMFVGDPGANPKGQRLDEVLGVERGAIENCVEKLRDGEKSVREQLNCTGKNGKKLEMLMNMRLLAGEARIEASFLYLPESSSEMTELQDTAGDLERFRLGVMGREKRILELKGEVNQLLKERGASPRYKTDDVRVGRGRLKEGKEASDG